MELSERKKQILKSIVDYYIKTGEPVGSKIVSSMMNQAISSATIRSEMAAMEEAGLLIQPHTSAGRIPTVEGYRYFIRHLMPPEKLTKTDKAEIDSLVMRLTSDMTTALPQRFAMAASEITDCTAINITTSLTRAITRFEVLRAGKRLAALMAVNTAGMVKTKVVMIEDDVENESCAVMTRILNTFLANSTPEKVNEVILGEIEKELLKYCRELIPVMTAVREIISEFNGYDVFIGGETKIFTYPEFSDISKARAFLSLLREEEQITRLALDLPEGINIDIVTNSELIPAEGMSVVSAVYNTGDTTSVLCVFGPKRMNFAEVQSKIGYFTKIINDIIKKSFFENE